MATKKKLLQAAAGSAGGAGLDVDEVFSTYLYTGDSTSPRTITNGIDLSGEGGLVWFKSRTTTTFHGLFDTERGATKRLRSDSTNAEDTLASDLTAFNSDGFTLGNGGTTNTSPREYASWTWRKAPKFFDVVTYTGNGVAGRTVSHNLGSVPGMIIVKSTSNAESWYVYHRGVDATAPEDYFLELEKTAARTNAAYAWNDTAPTSTEFTVGAVNDTNQNGATFVAYLFAHNDGDGEFGPDSDQDIIKCGSYTSGNTDGSPEVDLGFEPQWVMIKSTTNSDPWVMIDTMRGFSAAFGTGEVDTPVLKANAADAESSTYRAGYLTQTGFLAGQGTDTNENNQTYIYMAIRRGPLAAPENATDVFDVDDWEGSGVRPNFNSGFPVDMALWRGNRVSSTNSTKVGTRILQGTFLETSSTNSVTNNSNYQFDFNDGWYNANTNSSSIAWMWKRAPGFCDVVAYSGNSTAGRTVSHNLGVAPDMMWVKARNANGSNWIVYHKDNGNNAFMRLESNSAVFNSQPSYWNSTTPTDTDFTVGTSTYTNQSGYTFIAYLFATLAGISKVGSYTGDGTTDGSKVIDCGFSAGARFVLIKVTTDANDWHLFDTQRGIVAAGNDPRLRLNSTLAETTTVDFIDPDNSGFIVGVNSTSKNTTNVSGETYIFYAIA